ncbi:MAG: bacteriorhodopsin-like [Candidatus Nanopelagicales bacterium]
MEVVETLTNAQFQTVYNILSLALASMAATTVFLLAVTPRVLPRYRLALIVSAMVCFIAAYHYMRIFDSFSDAYIAVGAGTPGVQEVFELVKGDGFNEGYRYVDWLLTVPLLLFETVAVLALPASALMIILGYPGEVTAELAPKAIWGALSTIPFIYILYVLFVELSRAAKNQPNQVGKELAGLRWLLLATWGVYPISYAFPMLGLDGADAFVYRQVGYSIADVLAKCLYGLLIFKIARIKSMDDSPEFAEAEMKEAPSSK